MTGRLSVLAWDDDRAPVRVEQLCHGEPVGLEPELTGAVGPHQKARHVAGVGAVPDAAGVVVATGRRERWHALTHGVDVEPVEPRREVVRHGANQDLALLCLRELHHAHGLARLIAEQGLSICGSAPAAWLRPNEPSPSAPPSTTARTTALLERRLLRVPPSMDLPTCQATRAGPPWRKAPPGTERRRR